MGRSLGGIFTGNMAKLMETLGKTKFTLSHPPVDLIGNTHEGTQEMTMMISGMRKRDQGLGVSLAACQDALMAGEDPMKDSLSEEEIVCGRGENLPKEEARPHLLHPAMMALQLMREEL
jgi:hypothetical protein